MPAPTFVQEAETAWNDTASPRATASFAVESGDILVACAVSENHLPPPFSVSNSGTGLTWTKQQEVDVTDYTGVAQATAAAGATTSLTVSVSKNAGTSDWFGQNTLTFRDADGVGASAKTNVASGAPSLNLTTTQDNSAIVVAVGDWNAGDGSARTWRTVNSITPSAGNGLELTYFRDTVRYTLYLAYYPDAGSAGSKTVGLSAPSGQKYSIVAVEIKGTGGGGGGGIAIPVVQHHRQRNF
jgi:hypothetical protein